MSSTHDVISLARKRGGLTTTRDALDLGMARSTLNRRINDGVFVRLGKGVLALAGTSTRPDVLLRAAKQFHATWLEPIKGRVDFAYIEEEILIEGDRRRWHSMFEAFENDRRRDIAAQLAGWMVIRVTWRMITEEPEFVVDTVRQALSMRFSHSLGA